MKIVVINGQNHKGSTYKIGRMLAEKVGGEITEFFFPKDLNQFCGGCTNCILKDEKLCPHYDKMEPIIKAMDEADLLILTSPVYVYHVTGSMKAFLDHCAYMWMVHRPMESMFRKQAVCIATAAGAGAKWTVKDMVHSMFFWGVPKVYKLGLQIHAMSFEGIDEKMMSKIEQKTDDISKKIVARQNTVKPGIKTKFMFNIMLKMIKGGWNPADTQYWQEKGWTSGRRPWKE